MARQTKGRDTPTNSRERHETAAFSAKDERLALALARGLTRSDAARECSVGKRTIYTKLTDPKFRELVAEYRGQLLDVAIGLLADASAVAVAMLIKLLEDPKPEVQLRAACSILDQRISLGKFADIDDRLAEIERRMASVEH
jgi:hypothetical protein